MIFDEHWLILLFSSYLGMSWICGSTKFEVESKSQGKARSHLQKNMDSASGYDVSAFFQHAFFIPTTENTLRVPNQIIC
jgi:hypothetical protein